MKIINKSVAELIPYNKNAKKHDKTQVDNVAASIKNYGFVQPIVIDKNNIVVIGHCRLMAAQKLKLKEVPCVMVDDLTPEQVNALRIVDNKTNESEWDADLLLEELANINLDDFDFDFEELVENTPPLQLDEEDERENVIASLNCGDHDNYEQIKDRLQELADEIGGTLAVKMA